MFIKRIGNLICSMSADIPTKNLSDNSCLFFIHFKPTVYDIKPKRRTSNFIFAALHMLHSEALYFFLLPLSTVLPLLSAYSHLHFTNKDTIFFAGMVLPNSIKLFFRACAVFTFVRMSFCYTEAHCKHSYNTANYQSDDKSQQFKSSLPPCPLRTKTFYKYLLYFCC